MEDLGLNCSVCEERFSDECPPKNLGCGHSLCSKCVTEVLARDRKCPECRHFFMSSNTSDFVVNYPLLRMARILAATSLGLHADINLNTSNPASAPQPNAGECPAHGSRMFFRCMRCSVWVCRDCVVVDHPDPPRGLCRILAISDALEEMKKSHKVLVNAKVKACHKAKESLENKVCDLQAAQNQQRDTANRFRSLLVEINANLKELKSKKMEVLKKISEIDSMVEAVKQTGESVEQAATIDEYTAAIEDTDASLAALDKYIAEDTQEIPALLSMPVLSSQTLVGLLDAGTSIFATSEKEGQPRWARLTRQDDRLHLHALRDGLPRAGCFTLPYDVIRQLVPRDSPSIFMDIGWTGLVRGRVYIRMFGDTPRSNQTVYLCSGEKGPSYRGTSFYKAHKLDQPMESLRGGDFENNDGTGGRAIVDGITSGGVYYREIAAGLFVSWPAHELWHLGSFDIYLRDCPGVFDNSAHGIVTSGLDLLRLAARHKPITDTSVQDCGLIIPISSST
ncbi:uncharacterized protein LOC125028903 [Penaeus chinensis]|uniref:uncharacterized protein LOC125028903 n=1 Tax=Penaeus chinensis TaxID=139456 RepID=UPI001FB694D5|nr:uncharacterized protein LOC125028903 [Penaeus chinensis]XP_047474467.1 uncharacterized protein LOC125028903 [Penaeus chinensis]